jgi:hypothetical protein
MSTESTSSPCACGATTPNSCASNTSSEQSNSNRRSQSTTIQNGKGDAPRNISPRFRENYDKIQWSSSRT